MQAITWWNRPSHRDTSHDLMKWAVWPIYKPRLAELVRLKETQVTTWWNEPAGKDTSHDFMDWTVWQRYKPRFDEMERLTSILARFSELDRLLTDIQATTWWNWPSDRGTSHDLMDWSVWQKYKPRLDEMDRLTGTGHELNWTVWQRNKPRPDEMNSLTDTSYDLTKWTVRQKYKPRFDEMDRLTEIQATTWSTGPSARDTSHDLMNWTFWQRY